MKNSRASMILLLLAIASCAATTGEAPATSPAESERLTLATAQREIRVGMSGAEVLAAMGSPNIVSTDAERREVWVYDRISTVSHRTHRSGGIGSLLVAVGDSAGGALLPHAGGGSSTASTTQRTLTVIIKFDAAGQVRDFAYHASEF